MPYDPIGQGERLQYDDADAKASIIGNPTGEHGEANIGPLLIGDTLARYMVNDAVRGIDYLIARPDVDDSRIGAFGCSGGGTATALVAALDERIAAAATACYLTSFSALLSSATGVQEAEQSLPRFIASGLDFPDWVEAVAPRPYAIVSTEDDMFPLAGARQTFEEAQRIYGLYDARRSRAVADRAGRTRQPHADRDRPSWRSSSAISGTADATVRRSRRSGRTSGRHDGHAYQARCHLVRRRDGGVAERAARAVPLLRAGRRDREIAPIWSACRCG